jgi:PAS domain S-box-containing protein
MSALVAVLLFQINSLRNSAVWVDQTNLTIYHTGQLLNVLVEQESGLRGYLLTGEAQFLELFNRDGIQVPAILNRLDDLTPDNTDQQRDIDELRLEYSKWSQLAQERLKIGRTPGTVMAGAQLRNEQMDHIRVIIRRMIDREAQLRSGRIARTISLLRDTFLILGAAGAIAVLLIAWAAVRQMRILSAAYDRRLKDVQRQREWFNTTLHSIGDGVIACDAKGRLVFMNGVAEQLTGWSAAEAIDKPVARIFHSIHEHNRTVIEDPIEAARRMETNSISAGHTMLIRRDGTEIPLASSAAPLRGSDGEFTGAVLVFRDVTENRNSAEALRRAEKIAVAGRLAASIAHEINNPLEALTNLLYLAASCSTLEETREFIEVGQEQLQRASAIVAQTLEFHRGSPDRSNCAMTELLDSVLSIWRRRFASRHIEIVRDDSLIPSFTAYVSELRQLLTNLVANAYESMKSHGKLIVRTRITGDGQSVRITVADTGSGIDPAVRRRIFEPFFTTKATGTGLGLWVTAEIVRKHQGTLKIRSRHTQPSGTVVSVTIPLESAGVPALLDLEHAAHS